jgi:hypothetical protein
MTMPVLITASAYCCVEVVLFSWCVSPAKRCALLLLLLPLQTPTLGFTVERHQAIVAFQPEPFWVVRPQLAKVGGASWCAADIACIARICAKLS